MNIAFTGSHPLLGDLATYLGAKHTITSAERADVVIVGGFSNSAYVQKPTILLSSYLVYCGYNHREDITEETPVSIHPLSDLAYTTLSCLQKETILLNELKNVVVLRTFPVYGHIHDESVIKHFITSTKLGVPMKKYRLGWRTRSFLFVDDLFAGIDSAIHCIANKHVTGIYNIGASEGTTIQDAAAATWRLAGLSTEPTEEPWIELPWRPTRCVPNIERFSVTFDWQPKTSLTMGIKVCLDR